MSYYTATFSVGTHRFGDSFPKLQTFSEIFWAPHCEKKIPGIFVYLFIYKVTTTNVNFRFKKQGSQAATRLI